VKPISYALSDNNLRALVADLARPVESATLALARLDERLALRGRDPAQAALADGVRARAHLMEAQALSQLAGELVSLEDLVLHDAGMDVRAPSTGVARAARVLAERRQLAGRAPEAVLAPDAVRRLIGVAADAETEEGTDTPRGIGDGRSEGGLMPRPRAPHPWDMPRSGANDTESDDDALWREADGLDLLNPDEDRDKDTEEDASGDFAAVDALLARTRRSLAAFGKPGREPGHEPGNEPGAGDETLQLRDPAYGAAERLNAWLAALTRGEDAPAVLAAALALDAWLCLEPAERGGEIGFALAATVLRRRGIAAHHLPALGLGLRKGRFRWSPHQASAVRLAGLVAAIAESARLAAADLQRLTLAREVMLRRCEGRRADSRLGELVGLFVELPLVTTGLAAKRLGLTPQAVEAMLRELGPSLPRELTGRKRYRAWGIL
jgi:hypothetical protein